jgi:acetylglutamate synthase
MTDKHDKCPRCAGVLQALENIDDDLKRQKIHLVKTTETRFARRAGLTSSEDFPSLVFFRGSSSNAVPNVYEGDLSAEEEVLDWLIEMKVESHIELITRPMLESMVDRVQYLAVLFCMSS